MYVLLQSKYNHLSEWTFHLVNFQVIFWYCNWHRNRQKCLWKKHKVVCSPCFATRYIWAFDYFHFPVFRLIKCDALRDLVPFVQFKKREKHSSMGVFYFFKIMQMVPNRPTHHKYNFIILLFRLTYRRWPNFS